jgi:2-amino-4-hydroxy-6-hydroxymethyldihydropteridine diphosphokinase
MSDRSQWPLACIGLGSNLGQSRQLLLAAWQTLGEHPAVFLQQISPPYLTKPIDMHSPHWFINAAGLLRSSLSPHSLLDVLLETELHFGRVRDPEQQGYQDRTLDLDLLLYDQYILRTEHLILPHPKLHKRLFVLGPLADIAPELLHPLIGKSIAQLFAKIKAELELDSLKRVSWDEPAD